MVWLKDDPDRRLECKNIMEKCNTGSDFVSRIMFPDEAILCLNKQNSPNPNWMMEVHTLYSQKVTIWASISGYRILWPYFIEGTLTGEKYSELLRDHLVPALAEPYPDPEVPDVPNNHLWFQQNGAPSHYTINVKWSISKTPDW